MLIERILGANWRTTLTGWLATISGVLTTLAMLPHELGDVAEIIPANWKSRITIAGIIATALLKFINSIVAKDAAITGNGTINDPLKKVNGIRSKVVVMLAVLLVPFCLTGCVTGADGKARFDYIGAARTIDGAWRAYDASRYPAPVLVIPPAE